MSCSPIFLQKVMRDLILPERDPIHMSWGLWTFRGVEPSIQSQRHENFSIWWRMSTKLPPNINKYLTCHRVLNSQSSLKMHYLTHIREKARMAVQLQSTRTMWSKALMLINSASRMPPVDPHQISIPLPSTYLALPTQVHHDDFLRCSQEKVSWDLGQLHGQELMPGSLHLVKNPLLGRL